METSAPFSAAAHFPEPRMECWPSQGPCSWEQGLCFLEHGDCFSSPFMFCTVCRQGCGICRMKWSGPFSVEGRLSVGFLGHLIAFWTPLQLSVLPGLRKIRKALTLLFERRRYVPAAFFYSPVACPSQDWDGWQEPELHLSVLPV